LSAGGGGGWGLAVKIDFLNEKHFYKFQTNNVNNSLKS
jgi:hypothetical protein